MANLNLKGLLCFWYTLYIKGVWLCFFLIPHVKFYFCFSSFRGIELKNNEFGKVWTNIQQRKAHAEDDTNKMDQDLASKLKERSRKVEEVNID